MECPSERRAVDPRLEIAAEATFFALDWILWAAFAVEYGIRLYLAPEKWAFVKGNKIDLLVVVIPFLRPLRLMRSARALRALRAVRVMAFLARRMGAGRDVLTRHHLNYALAFTMLAVIGGAFLVRRSSAEFLARTSSHSPTRSGGLLLRSPRWVTATAFRRPPPAEGWPWP